MLVKAFPGRDATPPCKMEVPYLVGRHEVSDQGGWAQPRVVHTVWCLLSPSTIQCVRGDQATPHGYELTTPPRAF